MDVDFDKSDIKLLMELSMRMADLVRATSEWHRRMTSNRLAQNGQKIKYEALIPGAKVYFISLHPKRILKRVVRKPNT